MLERKDYDAQLAAMAGEPKRNSKAGREARKQRFIEIVLANPGITSQDAADRADIPRTTAVAYRREIVREHGQRYSTPSVRGPRAAKYAMDKQAKRLLESMSISLESYASTGISGIDPSRVDMTDPATQDNLASILDSLRELTRFAKGLERHVHGPIVTTENNVIQGHFIKESK